MANKATILERMRKDAEVNGFYLCPDDDLLNDLIDGLATNEDRYGYGSCPCRMASGVKSYDGDIICPCEYRDADINEFGMCYCALFVSKEVKEDPSKMKPIPERRPVEVQEAAMEAKKTKEKGEYVEADESRKSVKAGVDSKGILVWRCTVCGYLCARELPPPICPICKAKAERFERFNLD